MKKTISLFYFIAFLLIFTNCQFFIDLSSDKDITDFYFSVSNVSSTVWLPCMSMVTVSLTVLIGPDSMPVAPQAIIIGKSNGPPRPFKVFLI